MATEVVLIFDIGKTNKKVLLFDRNLKIVSEEESIFKEIPDDDGFMGDDIEKIEQWILDKSALYLNDPAYIVKGINFATYGATLMYIDREGRRLTPVYNYLKTMPEGIVETFYDTYGGVGEFSRKTASPALGMLNSGLQALWLKRTKPGIFNRAAYILHFPQYLSHFLTGRIASEHTSIGCHTGLWDFDHMRYHPWVKDEGLNLPSPGPVGQTYPARKMGSNVPVGIGIHDSSASLAPYFRHTDGEFILISTGTWCISMNPFNHSPLTASELEQDCLAYMSVQQKPVKSSRFFLGHIHDVNLERLTTYFKTAKDAYKMVEPDRDMLTAMKKKTGGNRIFFSDGIDGEYLDDTTDPGQFQSFKEAYHRMMMDLTLLTVDSINLIVGESNSAGNMYITGGFSKNPIFTAIVADCYPGMNVFTSEIANATSMGAALVLWKCFGPDEEPEIDLGLKKLEISSSCF